MVGNNFGAGPVWGIADVEAQDRYVEYSRNFTIVVDGVKYQGTLHFEEFVGLSIEWHLGGDDVPDVLRDIDAREVEDATADWRHQHLRTERVQ